MYFSIRKDCGYKAKQWQRYLIFRLGNFRLYRGVELCGTLHRLFQLLTQIFIPKDSLTMKQQKQALCSERSIRRNQV